jgi:2-polyprenyl-3-methyl-5-hydroxy-6-metoxy-1,4-benzoquinol methylase
MNPQPSARELAPFYDASYHVFDEKPMSSAEIDALIATGFDGTRLNHSAVFEGGKFLDIGCGLGDMVAAMQRLGMQARGIDPSPYAVSTAVAEGRAVEQGDLLERAFPDAEFDSISLYHSLEHTPDPLAMLRECARILSPRGELMVAVPNIEAVNARLFGRQWSHLSLPHHLQHFTKATLSLTAHRAGLHCVEMVTESLVWSVEQELCRWFRRNLLIPYRASERLHLFRPVAAILARSANASDRGDAIVAHFGVDV